MVKKKTKKITTIVTIMSFILTIIFGLTSYYVTNERLSNLFSDAFGWTIGVFGLALLIRIAYWFTEK